MIKESPRLGLTLENRFVAFGSQSTKSLWHCLAVDLGENKSQCLYWLKFCFYRFKMKAHRNEQKTKDKNYFKICITWISNEIVPNFDEQNSSHWMLKRKDSNTSPQPPLLYFISLKHLHYWIIRHMFAINIFLGVTRWMRWAVWCSWLQSL